jgi:hypothetical protein
LAELWRLSQPGIAECQNATLRHNISPQRKAFPSQEHDIKTRCIELRGFKGWGLRAEGWNVRRVERKLKEI